MKALWVVDTCRRSVLTARCSYETRVREGGRRYFVGVLPVTFKKVYRILGCKPPSLQLHAKACPFHTFSGGVPHATSVLSL